MIRQCFKHDVGFEPGDKLANADVNSRAESNVAKGDEERLASLDATGAEVGSVLLDRPEL
jgi:hypothetical protein